MTGATLNAEELEQRVFQLETLYEIGRECARVRSVADVLHITLSMVMGAFGVIRGIAFVGDAGGGVDAVHARGIAGDGRIATETLAQSYLLTHSPAGAAIGAGAGGAAGPAGSSGSEKGTGEGNDAGSGSGERTGAWLGLAGMDVCLPFTVDASTYGAVAVGPRLTGTPYTEQDHALLQTIVSNAAAHLRNVKLLATLQTTAGELARKVQALAVVNEIALGITSRPGTQRLHRFLLERVAGAVNATEGALASVGAGGWSVATRYAPDGAAPLLTDDALRALLAAGSDELVPRPHAGQSNGSAGGPEGTGPLHARLGERQALVPIRYGAELLGALWLRRADAGRGFDDGDRELLELLGNEVAVVLENSRLFDGFLSQQQEQFRLRGVLEQYLAPSVAERLISGQAGPPLGRTHCTVSIIRVDMRDSTKLVNVLDVDVMAGLMDEYIGRMTDVLFRYEGTIDRLDGDGVIGFFGAPEAHADDPLRAVRAGLDMHREFARMLVEWKRRYALPASLGIGVGIATGEVAVGNIGSAKRLHYTVSGLTANLAARLNAKALAGTILMDGATWNVVAEPLGLARGRLRRPRYYRAKGFAGLVPAYRLRPAGVST